MRKIKISLSSLAPDTFALGPKNLLSQFSPEKVLDIPQINTLISNGSKASIKTQAPWAVEIHPTSLCSLSCKRCSYGKRNKDRCELTFSLMENLLESLSNFNISSLIFSGGGDPLSWSKGTIRDCLPSNVPYRRAIATNGIGLKRALDKESLINLDIIQINVNGYDEQSYLNSTRRKLFSQFQKNIQWLFTNRDENITQITGKILIHRQNYLMIDNYLEFCVKLGFDLVVIKLAGNYELDQDVELTNDQKQELRKILHQSPFLSQYPAYFDAIATKDNTNEISLPDKCWLIEQGLYTLIRSNGDVFLCVTSPYTQENRIGNLFEQDLEEIWNNLCHERVKKKLHTDMRTEKCKLHICRHLRYSFLIEDAIKNKKYEKSKNLKRHREPKLL